LNQLAGIGADAVVVAGIHEFAAVCCMQLKAIGYTNPLLLGDDGFTPNLVTLAGSSTAGVSLVAPGPAPNHDATTIELTKRYRRMLGIEPGAYFLTSYAATWILLRALSTENMRERNSLADRLREHGWHTPIGDLRFDRRGEITGLAWTIYQIRNGSFVPTADPWGFIMNDGDHRDDPLKKTNLL